MSETCVKDGGKTILEKANVLWDVANLLLGLRCRSSTRRRAGRRKSIGNRKSLIYGVVTVKMDVA